MATDKIDTLLPLFNDLKGSPLENGSIYIGEVNKNPETNPISVYWDKDKTIPASQPLSTISGYISRNGTPSNIYIESNFSVTVKNSNDSIIFTELNNEFSDFKNFQDDEFTIFSGTKSFRFNAFYISANEKRVLEVQDKDGVIALVEDVVNLTDAQTIAGVKTFSSFPITPSSAPTTDYQVANKKYVDENNGLGYNQTLQDMTALRDKAVTYTNNTGKPINIIIIIVDYETIETGLDVDLYINGNIVQTYKVTSTGSPTVTINQIVPISGTYKLEAPASNDVISKWSELR